MTITQLRTIANLLDGAYNRYGMQEEAVRKAFYKYIDENHMRNNDLINERGERLGKPYDDKANDLLQRKNELYSRLKLIENARDAFLKTDWHS